MLFILNKGGTHPRYVYSHHKHGQVDLHRVLELIGMLSSSL
jgi:hypothetical protein